MKNVLPSDFVLLELKTYLQRKMGYSIWVMLCFILLSFFSVDSLAKTYDVKDYYSPVEPQKEHRALSFIIARRLESHHYLATKLDDKLSVQIYQAYIKALDPDKIIFTQQNIEEFDDFKTYVDDALKYAKLKPSFYIFNKYLHGHIERLVFMLNRLENDYDKIDFSIDESLETNREDEQWAKDTTELKDLWRKYLKNSVLSLKLQHKTDEEIKDTLTKRLSNQLNRLKQTKSEDAFRIYINALAESYDPHTQYFSPRISENFDIQMKLSLEGIGAILSEEDGYTKIKRIVPAGPADKSGKLKAGDRIVGVGQDKNGEIVDVVGWRLDDVVQLIRGKKDTIVQLKIIPNIAINEHDTKVIRIVRNTVKLEEQSARKEIIELKEKDKTYKIGVINLPTFYLDFKAEQDNELDYRSTTRDVTKLLQQLKNEKIDGLVLDLRNNGGGSLKEVNTLLGLFIKSGPTVQIKDSYDEILSLSDDSEKVLYDGPLVVLVNRLSASASEIFAGAIQDYQRGLVVGSQTFGKGTVQSLQPLQHGQLKLTHAKFYRVSGDSTQNLGVIPDVEFPPIVDHEELGESSLPAALIWDKIAPVEYQKYHSFTDALPQIKTLHQQRILADPDFEYMRKTMERFKRLKNDTLVSLNEEKRRKNFEAMEQELLNITNSRRKAKNQPIYKSIEDMNKQLKLIAEENEAKANPEDSTDESIAYLKESAQVVVDFINANKKSSAIIDVSKISH